MALQKILNHDIEEQIFLPNKGNKELRYIKEYSNDERHGANDQLKNMLRKCLVGLYDSPRECWDILKQMFHCSDI